MKDEKPLFDDVQESYEDDLLSEHNGVASATECTGLMPTPANDYSEAESYSEIYVVPKTVNEKEKELR